VARRQPFPTASAPAPAVGPLAGERTVIPAPANDNSRASVSRIVTVAIALAVALAVGLFALRPFG
jgi:hypothetical protein